MERTLADLSSVWLPVELRRNDGLTIHFAQAQIRHEKAQTKPPVFDSVVEDPAFSRVP